MEFHLVQNRKENCHPDHIPFKLKGNWILVFSVWPNWSYSDPPYPLGTIFIQFSRVVFGTIFNIRGVSGKALI